MPVTINGTTGINSPGGTFTGAVTTNGFANSMTAFNQMTTTVSNDNQVGVKIARTGGTNLVGWEIYNGSGDATKSLRFYETLDRMVLDASGRLTLPYQPAFLAGISSASDATYTAGQFLAFNTAPFNRGNNFNTSTNKFTAPVGGAYMFTYGMLFTNSGGNTQSMQAAINVNGNYPTPPGGDAYNVLACTPNSLGSTITLATSVVLSLSAGDVVGITNRSSNNLRIYQGHTFFGGYLLG